MCLCPGRFQSSGGFSGSCLGQSRTAQTRLLKSYSNSPDPCSHVLMGRVTGAAPEEGGPLQSLEPILSLSRSGGRLCSADPSCSRWLLILASRTPNWAACLTPLPPGAKPEPCTSILHWLGLPLISFLQSPACILCPHRVSVLHSNASSPSLNPELTLPGGNFLPSPSWLVPE